MMGRHKSPPVLFAFNVNLDQRVRADNPLRRIAELVDFSFVRDAVAHCYGRNGNVSVDPVVIMKMMLVLFLDDVASERELMRIIPERLDYLWFLGYGLDDPLPDHSVLSKARTRWGADVFETLFATTVALCVAHHLVDGETVHFDGSLIDANASTNSVVKGAPVFIEALRVMLDRETAKLDDLGGTEAPAKEADEPDGGERVNRGLVSTTDPDAPIVRHGGQKPRPRYKNHRSVDDACGVITATRTTAGDAKENGELFALVAEHERNTRTAVATVVADSQYGTVENFRSCQERGLRSHMADLALTSAGRGRRKGIFAERAFTYQEATDTYRCPAGQTLRRRAHKRTRRAYEYTAGKATCHACRLRGRCTRSRTTGRILKRHEGHALIEAARAESHSAAAKRDRRRRKHLMEGSFADAANNHGFKRSRWRRLWRQRIQDALIAAVQNVRILLRHVPARTKGSGRGGAEVLSRACVDVLAVLWLLGGLRMAHTGRG